MIGKNIKDYRKGKGWTQKDLADKSEMSIVAIGFYERGERIPRMNILQKIADALEVPINCLIDESVFDDAFLTYLQSLNCIIQTQNNSENQGYRIIFQAEEKEIFIDIATLDKIKSMVESDIRKLVFAFGMKQANIDGE